MFVEGSNKSLDDTYTAEEIAELVKGQYGGEQFA
jgi:phosphosulfolactate phosphohydrolase-like enzyme